MRVLMIDDETDFVRLVQRLLAREGLMLTAAKNGLEGIKTAVAQPPDVILLDWNLPIQDGMSVLKALKAEPKTQGIPVIMLTVRGREMDTVLALELGADDFVSKQSLRPRELVARVHAVLRKSKPGYYQSKILSAGALALDITHRTAVLDGVPLVLRAKEFDLLYTFLSRPGRTLTRAFLMETVWGIEDYGTSRTVDSTLARLRSRLGSLDDSFQAVKGVGYRFEFTN